jgi:hypothetical protein
MDERINQFLSAETIAVVGASSHRMKFGTLAYRALKKRGYKVYAVNPKQVMIDNDKCYPNLLLLPEAIDAVLISTDPDNIPNLIEQAKERNVKVIWGQRGPDYTELKLKADKAGIEMITDRCILMYAEPVRGVHALHRFVVRRFGSL